MNMRKLILGILIVVACLSLSGCFTFDTEHDRQILGYWEHDMKMIHEDAIFILALDPYTNDPFLMESWAR